VPTGESAAEDEPLPYDLKTHEKNQSVKILIDQALSCQNYQCKEICLKLMRNYIVYKIIFYLPCRISFSASSSFRRPRLRYCMPEGAGGMGPGDEVARGSIPSSSRVVAASTATCTKAGAWVGTTFGVQSPARIRGAVCQRFNIDEF
jgi:hypothetical protein